MHTSAMWRRAKAEISGLARKPSRRPDTLVPPGDHFTARLGAAAYKSERTMRQTSKKSGVTPMRTWIFLNRSKSSGDIRSLYVTCLRHISDTCTMR